MNTNKLKGLRVSKGYTQKGMAKELEMAIKTYNRKETGIVEFNRNEIFKLSEVLGLTLGEVNEVFFENKLTNRLIV